MSLSLKAWVKSVGGAFDAARLLGARESSISQWCCGKNNPSDKMKIKIHRLSKGRVTYRNLIESKATKNNGKKQNGSVRSKKAAR